MATDGGFTKKLGVFLMGGAIMAALGSVAVVFLVSPAQGPVDMAAHVPVVRYDALAVNEPLLVPIRRTSAPREIIHRSVTVGEVWMVRRPDGSVEAYPNRCSRSGCCLEYEPALARFTCECHRAEFRRSLYVDPLAPGTHQAQSAPPSSVGWACSVAPLPSDAVRLDPDGWIRVRLPDTSIDPATSIGPTRLIDPAGSANEPPQRFPPRT